MKKLILLTVILFCAGVINSQTTVPGGTVSGTWTLGGSPYNVTGSIQIANDSTLTIQPGVSVIFQGHYKLVVNGRLIAVGTAVDSITFTASSTSTGWFGIRFPSTLATNDTSRIQYCKLLYGKGNAASGDDSNAGGIFVKNFAKVVVSNSRISYCSCVGLGGAICCYNYSHIIIRNNTLSYNTGTYQGGGIAIYWSSPSVSNNLIYGNNTGLSNAAGGGITVYTFSTPVINGNTISNNTSLRGGGIFCNNGATPIIQNNTIINNYASYTTEGGGGIALYNSSPTISSNTIANNNAQVGGGLTCYQISNPTLRNNIIWGNTASTGTGNNILLVDEPSDPSIYYCDIQGGLGGIDANGNFYTGTNSNITNNDPLFVSPSGGTGTGFNGSTANWALQSISPCIDAGDPSTLTPSTDKAGNPRVTICRIDIGAYEYQNGTPFAVSIAQTATIPCNGYATGALLATASGSGAPYTYLWSPGGQTTASITGLTAGTYTCTASNSSGCSRTATFTITQPTGMSLSHTQVNVACNGNCTGSATVNVSGGTGPFSYSWNTTPVQTTATTTATLCTGGYTVTVTDGGGCTATTNVTITNPAAITVSTLITNVSCFGGSNGVIVINSSGGVAPMQYSINGGTTYGSSNTFSGLPAGSYSIVVKDNNACQTSPTTVVITQPTALSLSTSQTDLNCNGLCNGQATVFPSGGTPPYSYSWTTSPVQTTAATTATLCAGTYTVTVTDNAGCIATATVTIISTLPIVPICLVTVDTPSVYNVIDWEKPITSQIDSFRIYREVTTAVYAQVGSVSYDSLSEFIDMTGADPNATSFKYKLSVIDTCGGESAMSDYHNTIHLQVLGLGNLQWTLYDIEGAPNPVTFYRVLRSDDGVMPFAPISSTIPGSNTTYTDVAYASFPAAVYRVDVTWSISCNPTRTLINTTRSNIKHQNLSTSISTESLNEEIMLYPNPALDEVTIELSALLKQSSVTIFNALGQKVYAEAITGGGVSKTTKHIDLSDYTKGIYTISIESNGTKVFKKLVVN